MGERDPLQVLTDEYGMSLIQLNDKVIAMFHPNVPVVAISDFLTTVRRTLC